MHTLLRLDIETLPASLVLRKPLTDCEFESLCFGNDLIQFERTRQGDILMHAPTGGDTSDSNAEIISQLRNWWKSHRSGKVFDSNCGFILADRSIFSPDAAFVLPAKLQSLGKKERAQFLRLCPDFVVELLSASDNLADAHEKMKKWISNGAALAWLIDPYKRRVTIYNPGAEALEVDGSSVSSVEGSGPVAGFILDLTEVWSCYED